MNDNEAAHGIFRRLHDRSMTPVGNVLFGDEAFASSYTNTVVATEHYNPAGIVLTQAERSDFEKWRLVVRKGAEWGMRTLQGLYKRLTVPLSPDKKWNSELIEITIRLVNVTAVRMRHHNQLHSVFNDALASASWDVL